MALLDMIGELTGTIPGLSPILASKYINRAIRDICNRRTWSFLETDTTIVCPTSITTGAISITQYAYEITLDTDASAAIAAQLIAGATPGILNLQVRFGSSPTNGGIYTIVAFDDSTPTAVVLTLDRPVQEPTNATSAYQIYRCFFGQPDGEDFLRWESIVDINNAIGLVRGRLTLTSADLDRRDPQRAAQGLAYFVASWGGNKATTITVNSVSTAYNVPLVNENVGTPVYEFWPHPTQGQSFYCRYRRRAITLVDPIDELPNGLDESLVIYRALYAHVYPWALANQANFPQLKTVNFQLLVQQARSEYNQLYLTAMKVDNEMQLQDVSNRGHGLRNINWNFKDAGGYPIDSNFLQSHLVRW